MGNPSFIRGRVGIAEKDKVPIEILSGIKMVGGAVLSNQLKMPKWLRLKHADMSENTDASSQQGDNT